MSGLGHWYIELEKQAYWRGVQHYWVNRYVMSGSDPDASDAESVITDLVNIESQLHPNTAVNVGCGYIEGRAYLSTGGPPFARNEYNASKAVDTATGFGGTTAGGYALTWAPTLETCLLVETPMTGLSSTGKPVFNRKYIRGVTCSSAEDSSGVELPAAMITALNAVVLPWKTGMGASSWVVIGTSGRLASSAPTVHPYLVAHQVPRGKKRKTTTTSSGGSSVASEVFSLLGGLAKVAGEVGDSIPLP